MIELEDLLSRIIMLEARLRDLGEKYNAHTHGNVTTGAGSTAATGAASQIDTTFTLNQIV